jgi:hypothetical protein
MQLFQAPGSPLAEETMRLALLQAQRPSQGQVRRREQRAGLALDWLHGMTPQMPEIARGALGQG